MRGRTCERRCRKWHMRPIPVRASVAAVSTSRSLKSFLKNGRKIHVGDCALFEPPQNCMPFIGIVCKIIVAKEKGLRLCVNWLYRPSDVVLVKGSTADSAPNEIYYSFHKDEISASSLLHPCKVAFLRKGVELPCGMCSHVCRRVYDIEKKRLWWLTDRDYVNERKEELIRLLDRTQREMHGTSDSGGHSPNILNRSSALAQPVPHQIIGRKRERDDHDSNVTKREYLYGSDNLFFHACKLDGILNFEIAKITEGGGLVNLDGVEKLVQLMQLSSTETKLDLSRKSILVDVISFTDKSECLGEFLQLRGLPVLDEWLREAHRGKISNRSCSTEGEKSNDQFILSVLRALDKLPVNLDALKTCNIGKSVNYLRSHKNSEIQKKAKRLVDIWKKRVEAEMNMTDAKSSLSGVSWPSKVSASETSHVVEKIGAGPSENSTKVSPVASPGSTKSLASLASSMASNSKDSNCKTSGNSDVHMTAIKEERSSSSSQSMSNSRSLSFSSEHTRTFTPYREDAKSSTTESGSADRVCRHSCPNGERNQLTEPRKEAKRDIGKNPYPQIRVSCQGKDKQAITTLPISQISPGTAKLRDFSCTSMDALIESCDKFRDSVLFHPEGDDTGMNLLASVATGEVLKLNEEFPLDSQRTLQVQMKRRATVDTESDEPSEKIAQSGDDQRNPNGDDVSTCFKNNELCSIPVASAGDVGSNISLTEGKKVNCDYPVVKTVEIEDRCSSDVNWNRSHSQFSPVGDESDEIEASSPANCPGSDQTSENALNWRETVNLNFDLNEGLPAEPEGVSGEYNGGVQLPLPASITVTAAAKGAFIPIENLLTSKREFEWRGSASTSAFRPAERRIVHEGRKQGRIVLDIDLNEPYRTFDDVELPSIQPLPSSHDHVLGLDLNRTNQSQEFDLNSGPCLETDPSSIPAKCNFNHSFYPGGNNAPVLCSLPGWVSRRSTLVSMQDRGDGFQRRVSSQTAHNLLGLDMYRPQVASSSPRNPTLGTLGFPIEYPSLVPCHIPHPYFSSGGSLSAGTGSVETERRDGNGNGMVFLAPRQHTNAGNIGWNV